MLMDIISAVVAAEPDLVIVDKMTEGADLGSVARRARADVVIVQQASSSDCAEQTEFLSVQRAFKVIALALVGVRAFSMSCAPIASRSERCRQVTWSLPSGRPLTASLRRSRRAGCPYDRTCSTMATYQAITATGATLASFKATGL